MEQRRQSQHQQARRVYEQQQGEGDESERNNQPLSGSIERFRQSSYVQQPQGLDSSVARAGGDPQQIYGLSSSAQYGPLPAMHPGQLPYGQEMPTLESTRQQDQQYPQYGANLMYGMGHPQGAQTSQPPYEQVPPYRPRPGSSSETLANQIGVPQYYLTGQPAPAGGTIPGLATQNIPSEYPHPEAYPDVGGSAVHTYPANVMDPSQTGTYNPYAQQQPYAPHLQIPSDEQPFENYQAQIRHVFTLARDGSLRDIGARLLEISQYLLGNVEALGLTRDDEPLRDGRIRLWDEFNRAWLVSLQRQHDLTEQMIQNNRPLEGNLSIMDAPTLERLSSELVRLCDSVEKHGLVDYQMGVAEEEIMELLLRCLSLVNSGNEGGGQSDSAAPGASRRR